jgi:hypothetical protein
MIAAHNNAAEKCESARVPVNALKNLLGAAVGTTASAVPPGDKIASAAPSTETPAIHKRHEFCRGLDWQP